MRRRLSVINRVLAGVMTVTLLGGLAGCSHAGAATSHRSGHNGEVLSRTMLTNAAIRASERLYRLYYWCGGQRVEAYLTVPTKVGRFPLLVALHGGSAWHAPHSGFGETAADAASAFTSRYVTLYPEYQGYMGSTGSVRGLHTDAMDTVCAIRAAEATGRIQAHAVYLLGYSLGGGVALTVAGLLPEAVRAVVAVSPWVGMQEELPWLKHHAHPGTIFGHELQGLTDTYGVFPSRAQLAAQSPDLAVLKAPVLLLQGTADTHVPYQVVEEFYRRMKTLGKVVRLIIFPGGHHGLHGPRSSGPAHDAIFRWLLHYGLPRAH